MEHYGANILESRIALESQLKVTLSLKRDSVLLWKISFSSAGRKIAPNTGANAIKFFSLATKSWKLVAKLATRMLHHNRT